MAEPIANAMMNATRTGFRPSADTRLPTRGRTAVDAIVYALPMKSVLFRSWTKRGGYGGLCVQEGSRYDKAHHRRMRTKSRAESRSTIRFDTYTIQKAKPSRALSLAHQSSYSFDGEILWLSKNEDPLRIHASVGTAAVMLTRAMT